MTGFYGRKAKRWLDVAASLFLIVILSPLLAILGLAVLVFMGRPVLFVQRRPGRKGVPFRLRKFRTMTQGTDSAGQLLADDLRLTRFGRFLRRTSLDELPELVNVLRGDMSLVGPRPLLMRYLELYSPEQMRRHEVRPGITGLSAVSGRNVLAWDDKFRLDVWYVDHVSFWLDMKVMAMTLVKVLRGRDTSAPGHATMPEFKGNHGEH